MKNISGWEMMLKKLVFAVALISLTGAASADDSRLSARKHSVAGLLCVAGRLGIPFKKLSVEADDLKVIWEGCRQEAIKDISCYPYTINEANNSRTMYMPGTEPSNALYEPWVADCKGRVGRFPAWPGVKEDFAETERMASFYLYNPPGELQKPRSR